MQDSLPRVEAIDLSGIPDPDVRRALRAIHKELNATMDRQQMQIEALLEMMIEKHVGSLGEFKRHLMRRPNEASRGGRIHEAIAEARQAMHNSGTGDRDV